jgi:hypothetical protein
LASQSRACWFAPVSNFTIRPVLTGNVGWVKTCLQRLGWGNKACTYNGTEYANGTDFDCYPDDPEFKCFLCVCHCTDGVVDNTILCPLRADPDCPVYPDYPTDPPPEEVKEEEQQSGTALLSIESIFMFYSVLFQNSGCREHSLLRALAWWCLLCVSHFSSRLTLKLIHFFFSNIVIDKWTV